MRVTRWREYAGRLEGGRNRLPLLDAGDRVVEACAQGKVGGGTCARPQGVDDVDAGTVECREQRGEAREGELAQQVADQRQAQLQGVRPGAQGCGARQRMCAERNGRAQCEQHCPAPFAHHLRQADEDARLQRQGLPGAAQQTFEFGYDLGERDHDREQEQDGNDASGRSRLRRAWLASSSSCASASPISRIAFGHGDPPVRRRAAG